MYIFTHFLDIEISSSTHAPMSRAINNVDEQDISHSFVKTHWQPLLMCKPILTAGQSSSQLCRAVLHTITISYINTDAVFLKTMKTLMIVCIRNQQTCLCPKEKLWPHHNGDLHCITTVTYVVCLIIMDVGEAILVAIPILHSYRLCFLIFPMFIYFKLLK